MLLLLAIFSLMSGGGCGYVLVYKPLSTFTAIDATMVSDNHLLAIMLAIVFFFSIAGILVEVGKRPSSEETLAAFVERNKIRDS